MAKQLTLDLALRPALDREDFLVAESNLAAVALVDQWPNWPGHSAAIVGPNGSGKTHLAQVWCKRSNAHKIAACSLVVETVPDLFASGALLVEDVSFGAVPETALFHLLNFARQNDSYVLFTGTDWNTSVVRLPDLLTRLATIPIARILDPDDDLLRGVLVKLFADRQITVDEGLISFLVTRMPRSLDAASHIVARIDAAALEEGAEVTRNFAARVLVEMENPPLF